MASQPASASWLQQVGAVDELETATTGNARPEVEEAMIREGSGYRVVTANLEREACGEGQIQGRPRRATAHIEHTWSMVGGLERTADI